MRRHWRKWIGRVLLASIIVPLLAVTGMYFYFTHQFEQQVARQAAQLSPFGQLQWNRVQLHPTGEARIHELKFLPHSVNSEIRIERIAFRAPDLFELLQSSNEFKDGRLPEALGISIRGLQIALDERHLGDLDSGFGSGIPFEAAGCNGRDNFSVGDLTEMNYWNLIFDLDLGYEITGGGETIAFRLSTLTRNVSGIVANTRFRLGSSSRDMYLMMRAWAMAQLTGFDVTYRNLGFHERMIQFCAAEIGMSQAEYLDHHHDRWTEAWAALGLRPNENLQRAYREFLDQPEDLMLISEPVTRLPVTGFTRMNLDQLAPQLNLSLSVNQRPRTGVELVSTERRVAESTVNDGVASGNADSTRTTTGVSRWSSIPVREAGHHIGAPIIIRTSDGRSVRGHLNDTDAEYLHIRIRSVGGYLVRPYEIDRIESIQVIRYSEAP